MAEIAKAYVQIVPTTQNIAENIKKAFNGVDMSSVGDNLGTNLGNSIKNSIIKLGIGTLIGKTIGDSIKNGADFEQLWGGAEKIFDGMDTGKILGDAKNAYKELGMSVNEYLAKINDVGAAFKASMGSEAGYETAKKGLKAISDYASGTGKELSLLSEKFTMITRSTSSYQSIADQFSGILPATSQAFLEQAQAAGDLSEEYKSLSQVPIAEYQMAVTNALERGVDALNLTGNTAREASSTLSGSVQQMKAAWDNFKTSLTVPDIDMSEALDNLLNAFGDVVDNLVPVFEEMAPNIANALASAFTKLVPKLLEIISRTIGAVVKSIPEMFNNLDFGGIVVAIALVGAAFLKIIPAIKAAADAVMVFNAFCAANPYVAMGIAIAALAAGAIYAADKFTDWFLTTEAGQKLIDKLIDLENEVENAGGVANWVKGKFSDAFGEMKTSVSNTADAIKTKFETMVTAIESIIGKFATEMKQKLSGMFDPMIEGLKQADTAVETWMTSFGPKAKQAVDDLMRSLGQMVAELPQKLREVGQAMAQGIANGFSEKIQKIRDNIKDEIEKISGMIKGIFQTGGYSQLGATMAQGINAGFMGEMARVNRNIQGSIDTSFNVADSSLINSVRRMPGSELSNNSLAREIAEELSNISITTNVTLQGDADNMFKVIQDRASLFNRTTGRSAFA